MVISFIKSHTCYFPLKYHLNQANWSRREYLFFPPMNEILHASCLEYHQKQRECEFCDHTLFVFDGVPCSESNPIDILLHHVMCLIKNNGFINIYSGRS